MCQCHYGPSSSCDRPTMRVYQKLIKRLLPTNNIQQPRFFRAKSKYLLGGSPLWGWLATHEFLAQATPTTPNNSLVGSLLGAHTGGRLFWQGMEFFSKAWDLAQQNWNLNWNEASKQSRAGWCANQMVAAPSETGGVFFFFSEKPAEAKTQPAYEVCRRISPKKVWV